MYFIQYCKKNKKINIFQSTKNGLFTLYICVCSYASYS